VSVYNINNPKQRFEQNNLYGFRNHMPKRYRKVTHNAEGAVCMIPREWVYGVLANYQTAQSTLSGQEVNDLDHFIEENS